MPWNWKGWGITSSTLFPPLFPVWAPMKHPLKLPVYQTWMHHGTMDPHKQFSDWNASWMKFKFPSPSRQFMKPMSIATPLPPSPLLIYLQYFRHQIFQKYISHPFCWSFLHHFRYNWPYFARAVETSSVWTLFVAAGDCTPQSQACAELWISLHKNAVILRASQPSSIFWEKRMKQTSLPKGQFLGMGVGMRAFGDVLWFLLEAQIRQALAVGYREVKK